MKDDSLIYPMTGAAEYLIDSRKTFTFQDVSSDVFSPVFHRWEDKTLNIGYQQVAVWVRFTCRNIPPHRTWLIKTDIYDDVWFYFPQEDGGYREMRLGRKIPTPGIFRRFSFFYVDLPAGVDGRPIYVRYEHEDTMLIHLSIQAMRTLLTSDLDALLNGIFIGLIVALVAYNLLLFLFLKDLSYVYYSLFISAIFFLTLIFSGIIMNAIPPGAWLSVDKFETIGIALALTFHIMFMRKYLMSELAGRRLDRALLILAAVCAAHMATIFFVPYLIRTLMLFILFVITVVFNVILVVDCIKRKYTPVRFFIIAWIVLVLSVVVFTLRNTAVLDSIALVEYAMQIGVSLEAVLFAFGLAFRINILQQEKARADEWGRKNLARAERMQQDYQQLFETAPLGIALLDLDGTYLTVNRAYCHMYGRDSGAMIGKHFFSLVYSEERAGAEKIFWDTLVAGPKDGIITFERTNLTASGKPIIVRYFLNFTRSASGEMENALCCVEDITDLRKALDDLRSTVTEKDLLLKEVHHRVKNNMQIIISLFRLRSRETDDPRIKSLLGDTAGRIRAIANIHNRIYLSKDVSRVDAESFIPSMVKQALSGFHLPEEQCHVVYSIDPVSLSVDIALPLSLILNELITNSVIHGHVENTPITITVSFRTVFTPDGRSGRMLEVTDTGRGFPAGSPISRFETFGLSLVETLTSQLDGEMTLETAPHTRITVLFGQTPLSEPGERRVSEQPAPEAGA